LETQILLTFDLEEFDLPLEFGCHIADEDQINISNDGLKKLSGILSGYNIPATFFTTSFYAEKNKELVKSLSEIHEIASHSKYHSRFNESDIAESKSELEKITGKQIYGFRMPRFKKTDLSLIKKAGYSYDSSINPTFLPGRYNNLTSPRKVYHDASTNLIEIPASVSPLIRFPLFWLSFKNLPFPFYIYLCKKTMIKDSSIHLYFHPWEFAELESFNIPGYIKTPSGDYMCERFDKFIAVLRETGDFTTISDFLKIRSV